MQTWHRLQDPCACTSCRVVFLLTVKHCHPIEISVFSFKVHPKHTNCWCFGSNIFFWSADDSKKVAHVAISQMQRNLFNRQCGPTSGPCCSMPAPIESSNLHVSAVRVLDIATYASSASFGPYVYDEPFRLANKESSVLPCT